MAILQNFIDRKVDIDCVDGQQRTPLMWAASTGFYFVKKIILTCKRISSIKFHFVFTSGAVDALRLLYKYGANQLHVDKDSLSGINERINR